MNAKQCSKRKYDFIGAQIALMDCRRSRDIRRQEVRIYKCDICGKYHLTSMQKEAQ